MAEKQAPAPAAQPQNVWQRLYMIQQQLKAPKNQHNDHGNYNYRSAEQILENVKPLLQQYRCVLFVTDDINEVGGRVYVTAHAVLRSIDTGEQIETTAHAREAEFRKGMDDSQITGAASSYARKYALNGLLAIDDTKDADALNNNADFLAPPPPVVCARCNFEIKAVKKDGKTASARTWANHTAKKYGVPLCYECAVAEKEQQEREAATC